MPGIVYNALALRPEGSGVQRYICQLLTQLRIIRPDWHLQAIVQADAVAELPEGVGPLMRPPSRRVRRALQGLGSVEGADLVHGLDVDVPLRRRAPTVATVHDLAAFDLPWADDRVRAVGERLLLSRAVRSSDAVIAVSHFTAERIATRWHRQAVVVHEAAGPDMYPASAEEIDDCRRRYRLPERFVLYVGNFDPRKGLEVLTAACRMAELSLVVAGGHLGRRPPAGAATVGYVPSADLRALYSTATVFAFPSRYEGFGLPPLEAMACGVPVVASRIPPLVEVLGDAARLVSPDRPDAWAQTLTELFADEDARHALIASGHRQAGRFTWVDAAEATVCVYRDLGVF